MHNIVIIFSLYLCTPEEVTAFNYILRMIIPLDMSQTEYYHTPLNVKVKMSASSLL